MPYDEIPTAGRHPGDTSEHKSGSNVRAPGPPEPGRYKSGSAPSLFRIAKHKTKGTYRVRAWTEPEMEALGDDYEEVGQYESEAQLSEGLSELDERNKFVVFEDRDSGEVQVGEIAEVSDNISQKGSFDQFTLFDSEEAAAQYAEERES